MFSGLSATQTACRRAASQVYERQINWSSRLENKKTSHADAMKSHCAIQAFGRIELDHQFNQQVRINDGHESRCAVSGVTKLKTTHANG